MLVELSVVEQRYHAVMEVAVGVPVTQVAARYGVSRQSVHSWCASTSSRACRDWRTGRTGRRRVRTGSPGRQLDVRPVKAFGDGSDITEQAVASYVAKYATKAAENTGTLDRRIGELAELDRHQVPDHTRRLITACRDLDSLYPDRRLWAWAHMLGFRGHFSSKSRTYSTTLGALRQERADYRAAQEASVLGLDDREPDTVLVLADWQYAGHGHTPGEAALAATIARDLQTNRETARDALLNEGSTE